MSGEGGEGRGRRRRRRGRDGREGGSGWRQGCGRSWDGHGHDDDFRLDLTIDGSEDGAGRENNLEEESEKVEGDGEAADGDVEGQAEGKGDHNHERAGHVEDL